MHVLHIVSSIDPRSGGPVTALQGLAEAQAALGVRVSILSTFLNDEDTSLADRFRAAGITVRLIGPTLDRKIKWRGGIASVIAQLCAQGVDAIHVHGVWEEVQHQAGRVARKKSIPYILRPCGMLDPWSLLQGGFHKRLYLHLRLKKLINGAAAIHFTTDIERDLAKPLCGNVAAIVEPNGLNLSEFADPLPHGEFRARHPQLQQKPVVLFLSRLHFKKGLDVLIGAFAKMKTTDAQLVIAGPDHDGYQVAVEKMAERAGVLGRVLFPGMLSGREKVAAYADADLFILPSRQENFGNVVIESLAAGTPVVISDQVNLCNAVRSANVGGVVPLDAPTLAAELDRWLADESLRRETGLRARDYARTEYAWPQIAARWSDHYERMKETPR